MRRTLIASILLNSLLAGTIGYIVLRLGGLKYVFYRLGHTEAGLYTHRSSLFQKLPAGKNAIIFLGDSQIEQCEWGELMAPLTDAPILNRGITGDQVSGVLQRLPEINRHQPSRVFICAGINDLIFNRDYADIETDYHQIVLRLRAANPSAQIFIVSILPVNNQIRRIGVSNNAVMEMNIRLQQIARYFAIPYVDLYSRLTDSSGNLSALYSSDGIHLNADGYLVWRKLIEKHLK